MGPLNNVVNNEGLRTTALKDDCHVCSVIYSMYFLVEVLANLLYFQSHLFLFRFFYFTFSNSSTLIYLNVIYL